MRAFVALPELEVAACERIFSASSAPRARSEALEESEGLPFLAGRCSDEKMGRSHCTMSEDHSVSGWQELLQVCRR